MLLDHTISNAPATTSSIQATVVGDIEAIAVISFPKIDAVFFGTA
jgi:hypothetical protein